jgi:hypothetical protein
VEVEDGDQVEQALAGPIFEQVGGDPVERDPTVRGDSSCLFEPDLREVDAGHPPAALGHPNGVAAFAAAQVESPPRRQSATPAARKRLGSAPQTSPASA